MGRNDNTFVDCFGEFDAISPKKKEPSIQVIYEYEKHYMELVKKYEPQITMIADMLSNFRKEQELFYKEVLPEIISKLNQDKGIDEEMKKVWLKRLTTNIDRSFALSETLINDYTTKNISEFKAVVNEKLRKL